MCTHCDDAVRLFGLGSSVALTVARYNHPPTPEELRAVRERREAAALSDLVEAVWQGIFGPYGCDCECHRWD